MKKMAEHLMPSRSELIERAARAFFASFYRWSEPETKWEEMNSGVHATYCAYAEAAINAIAPGLLDRTAWVAPWEPTSEMLHAATMQAPTWDDEASAHKWRAMRDAHLNQPPPASPQASRGEDIFGEPGPVGLLEAGWGPKT